MASDSQGRPKFSNFTLTAMLEAESTTGVPALAMLKQMGLLPSSPSQAEFLDNACGSGVVAKRLFENIATSEPNSEFLCGDLDQTMVNMMSDSIKKKGWKNVTVD
jgi:ubiquinone/menaquinone biosynthesis C-methylase UbiE